jgi:adenylate cyclase
MTIFFSDIADFTTISEQLTPEKLVENLKVYFKGMSSTILSNSGTVDKYIGDAIMAFWGAPNYIENHAVLACISALKCQNFLKELSEKWKNENQPMFKTRIGLNTGEVTVGNVGYEERLNYTVLGDNVNLASRLEGLNKFYGTKIIISESTYEQAKDFIEVRKLDLVSVKGKSKGVYIYQLISEKDNIQKSTRYFLNLCEEGFDLYLKREWQQAIKVFQETLRLTKFTDKASKMLLDRCKEYLKNPPDSNWNGVYAFHEK